ncbi:PDZ domain-containing protein [bacterium]|nr:MAG: PDZ domain-containing protein [bacterium]
MSALLLATLALAQTKTPAAKPVAVPALPGYPAGTVKVPFRIGERAMIVDANINGRTVSLMFDTGFGGYVLVGDGVSLGKPTGKMTLRDFVGEQEADTVKITSLKLGGRSMRLDKDALAVVQSGSDYSSSYNTHCDGIMGFSVIKDNITEINFQDRAFYIYPDGYDITKKPVDNKTTFLNKLLPMGNSSMEMRVKTKEGKPLTLALDTGNAFYATTHKEVLERTGLWTPGTKPKFIKQSYVNSGAVDSFDIRLTGMNVFGVPVESAVWNIIDLPSSSADADGTVGFGFLKNFNILIDYDKRRVWMKNWSGKTADEEDGDIGIGAYFDPSAKRTVIYRVIPEGPAAKAGIKQKDVLIAIDGKEVGNIGYRRLTNLFEGPLGSKVEVTVSREGGLKKFTLERAHLVNDAL